MQGSTETAVEATIYPDPAPFLTFYKNPLTGAFYAVTGCPGEPHPIDDDTKTFIAFTLRDDEPQTVSITEGYLLSLEKTEYPCRESRGAKLWGSLQPHTYWRDFLEMAPIEEKYPNFAFRARYPIETVTKLVNGAQDIAHSAPFGAMTEVVAMPKKQESYHLINGYCRSWFPPTGIFMHLFKKSFWDEYTTPISEKAARIVNPAFFAMFDKKPEDFWSNNTDKHIVV